MKPISLVFVLLTAGFVHAGVLTIKNESVEVRYDPASKHFSLVRGQRAILSDGVLEQGAGEAKVNAVDDRTFGKGQAIEVGATKLMVFPALPFVLVRSTFHNGKSEPEDLNRVPIMTARVDLPGELTTMGTGGLQNPEKNTGSYAWMAIAEPKSRNGIVAGWITEDRGSGVLFSPVADGAVQVAAQIDYGRLRIKPGASAESETLALGYFADSRLGLEAYADAIAKVYSIKLPPQPAGFCTWYSDKHGGACDERNLADLAAFAAKELKPFGFSFVQIDDHWQSGESKNGPKRGFMEAKPNGPYPQGMKATAEHLTELGLTPGIWFMPFAGTSYDPFFAPHQDWFYKDKDGKPFQAKWGGTCLDMSVPGSRDYLKQLVRRISREWGYKLFKMDGLWTGTGTRLMYINNGYKWDDMGEATPADPDKTQIEVYRDGLKVVRDAAGSDVFLLGCCVSQNMRSLGGAFGLLDAMRIGPDTGAGHIGAPHASRNYFLNGRVWWNDPDCVSVRAKTPLDQARVNATFATITGDLFYNSDWMPDLPAERLEILKRTMPAHGLFARPVDYFENDPARIWRLAVKDRDVLAIFNWGKSPVTLTCSAPRLGLPTAKEYVAFDFWQNRFLPPFQRELTFELPPASCCVLSIRPVVDHPQLISTSRHITQGLMDVVEEKWDPATNILSGVSRVVANDPYELRVVVPVGDNSWHARSPAKQQGSTVRTALISSVSAKVSWQIKFDRGPVASTR
jgi:hypothetical protein